MLEALLLALGLTTTTPIDTIKGTCIGLEPDHAPCVAQVHKYGNYFVTDGEVTYRFRQVWWGVYDMTVDGSPLRTAHCSPKGPHLICSNTFSFIADP